MDTEKPSKVRPLTPKQQRFVEEYLVDLNATQAAIRSGYSQKTAGAVGHENLKKPEIAKAIAAGREKQSKRTEINADWLLKRLADEVDADQAELYDEKGQLKRIQDWPMVWRKGLVAGMDVDEIKGEGGSVLGYTRKIKISDRLKRLELIGRHIAVGAFLDKHEHTGKNGAPLNPEPPSVGEVARRVAFLLAAGIAKQDVSA